MFPLGPSGLAVLEQKLLRRYSPPAPAPAGLGSTKLVAASLGRAVIVLRTFPNHDVYSTPDTFSPQHLPELQVHDTALSVAIAHFYS